MEIDDFLISVHDYCFTAKNILKKIDTARLFHFQQMSKCAWFISLLVHFCVYDESFLLECFLLSFKSNFAGNCHGRNLS